jgi:uncharacterized alpha-E superfamily protein
LAYLHVNEIIARGLHEFLDHLQVQLNEVGEAIQRTFFSGEAGGARPAALPARSRP